MCRSESESGSGTGPSVGCSHSSDAVAGVSRRGFLGGLGGTAALGTLAMAAAPQARAASAARFAGTPLPLGVPLRVKPVLVYQLHERKEKTSWRPYGEIEKQGQVDQEVASIKADLKKLTSRAEFPIEMLPLALVSSRSEAEKVGATECDMILVYAAGSSERARYDALAAKVPNVMFIRHRSGQYYLSHEVVHWLFLRKANDTIDSPNLDVDDIVVDDYDEVLWRLRALYGLKNARGTKVLAIGGLRAYSIPGQNLGPAHAKDVWGYEITTIATKEFAERLEKARADEAVRKEVERQTAAYLAQPNVTLHTDRKSVVNSFLGLKVCKEFMSEIGATNFGFASCMGSDIEMLDTPPCFILSLANDEGLTAYCHTDLTHTVAGVLLRWIAGKPSFVCNSHFPHDGIFTVAHCAAPTKMNGKDCEPTKIMTHFESDYGAATKVDYAKNQVLTVVVPNLHCTKWMGFRAKILDTPSRPACRTQIDMKVDGDWRKLITEMQGFHTQVCYGDYLREVGYALKKVGRIDWQNISEKT